MHASNGFGSINLACHHAGSARRTQPSVPPWGPLRPLYPPLHPENGCRAVDATFSPKKRGRGHNAGSIIEIVEGTASLAPLCALRCPCAKCPGGQINAGGRGACTFAQSQRFDQGVCLPGCPPPMPPPAAEGANSRPPLEACCSSAGTGRSERLASGRPSHIRLAPYTLRPAMEKPLQLLRHC